MEGPRKGVVIDALVASAAMALGSFAVLWILRHPDAGRTINMRACLVTKRVSQSLADKLQVVANNAATQYHSLTLSS